MNEKNEFATTLLPNPNARDKWAQVFHDNYFGRSPEAKSLEPFLKQTYKGNTYVPWAVMERLTYMQDPNAVFIKIKNEHGGLVHTDTLVIESLVKGETSRVMSCSHFVEVSLTFLGKTFVENYPVQDASYGAPKMYEQNQVNKALQRALAKVASRATGLGLSLYESGDLNFDDTVETTSIPRPEVKRSVSEKTTEMLTKVEEPAPVVEEPKVEEPVKKITRSAPKQKIEIEPTPAIVEPVVEPIVLDDTDVDRVIAIIKNEELKAKVLAALRSFNPSFIKNYGMTITTTDSIEELREKLSKLSDVDKFLRALERVTQ